ncbi:hypothetical protein [Pinibacter aurantiacus]|uniref:Uncharacterized protein n=1 Tax=Pinibacter aurantiacus TaxID=2851599 RepID=A0A9E2SBK7_9BACT|nr:hypothetical protein [Pinibacter aurantiacus]MBV4359516.1 hypothetical protein [Pinibacter aurantiacus]
MKRLFYYLGCFLLPFVLVFLVGILLPPTPRAADTSLFTSLKKDSLLKNVPSRRLILVGGSNLMFSLNSQILKDSLHLNPVNTGVHALLTLHYMLDNTIQYVQPGDVVVLIPEYEHFFKDYDIGTDELLRTVLDVNKSKIKLLNVAQVYRLLPLVPRYALTKFKPTEYFGTNTNPPQYRRNTINQFGDETLHWTMKRPYFAPYKITAEYNPVNIEMIKEFQRKVEEKKASFIVSFPAYQDSSYDNSAAKLEMVEAALKQKFVLAGSAKRYRMVDSLMFDTPYHLVKSGVDRRTEMLVEDLKKALNAER